MHSQKAKGWLLHTKDATYDEVGAPFVAEYAWCIAEHRSLLYRGFILAMAQLQQEPGAQSKCKGLKTGYLGFHR